MKKWTFIITVMFLSCNNFLLAQSVGIGTSNTNASAQVDISSNNKGLLIPRMAQTERELIPPVECLMLYNTNA